MVKYYIVLVIIIFTGCSAVKRSNKISKIEIATGYCNGECPFTAVRIYSSLDIEFYGGDYANKKGFYKGKLKQADWDYLTSLLDSIHYQELDTLYRKTVDDQELELIVTTNKNSKHIVAQSGSLPKHVASTFYKIANIYIEANMTPVKDTILFNTKIQYLTKITKPHFLPPGVNN